MTKALFIFLLITFCFQSMASIYGEDDRQLVFQSSEESVQTFSESIAAKLRVPPRAVGNGKYIIETKNLNEHIANLCPGENFEYAQTASNCTGFIVDEDVMATAAHCLSDQDECNKSNWLFSSEIDPHAKEPIVDKEDFVQCEYIINTVNNYISKNDWVLFKVSKSTKKRPSLKFRTSGKINDNARLTVIGHPNGLPLITSGTSKIVENHNQFIFKINSDTFGGNSGSPVFNENTGLVEGILKNGDLDYKFVKSRNCRETYKCLPGQCKGEGVVRITNIPELVPNMTPVEPYYDPRRPQL